MGYAENMLRWARESLSSPQNRGNATSALQRARTAQDPAVREMALFDAVGGSRQPAGLA